MAPSDQDNSKVEESKAPAPIQETIDVNAGADTAAKSEDAPLSIAKNFGRYKLESKLGEGAMGAVYLAHDMQLDRKVALKIPKFKKDIHQKVIKRFYQEAKSAATLDHPNICSVYDVGEHDGHHYISMAYIKGQSLSDFVNPKDPPSQRAIAMVVRKLAIALEEAHSHSVIHRDLKPANIMIDQRKEPIIMDFGLAKQLEKDSDARLTNDGTILGSPAYMSPEQLEGNPAKIGPLCDVYSLGVVLYELLTGELPFRGSGSVMSVITQVMTKPTPSALETRNDLHPQLSAVCAKAMAKQPNERFGSMKDFAGALTAFLKKDSADSKGADLNSQLSNASNVKDESIIRWEEQSKLARSLCNDKQYAAALSVLKPMTTVTDPRATKLVEWAKNELPKVELLASETANSTPTDLSVGLLGDDVMNQEFTSPAANNAAGSGAGLQPTLATNAFSPKPTAKKKAPFAPWMLWLIPIPIVLGLILVGLVIAWQFSKSQQQTLAETASEKNVDGSPNSKQKSKKNGNQSDTQHSEVNPSDEHPEDAGPPRRAENIFAELDRNGDGILTAKEVPVSEMRLVAFADADQDGEVTQDELEQHVRIGRPDGMREERIKALVERIMKNDANSDGLLTPFELPGMLKHLMPVGDANRNRTIEADELKAMIEESQKREIGGGRIRPNGQGPFGPRRPK